MPHRVLIVDDDDATRNGLKTLLQGAGYEVLTTNSVPEARWVLHESAPDLLITDVRLGEFNGLQLIAMNELLIPAIVVTGFVDPVLEADAHRLGAHYLVKPIAPAMLLALVKKLLPIVQQHENRSDQ